VAVPVAGEWAAREVGKLADETVILAKPVPFFAVAQAYEKWYDVPDREVLAILSKWQAEQGAAAAKA
jgi:putative phosphoribosyl transferase